MWHIQSSTVQPPVRHAIYFVCLPEYNEVRYNDEIDTSYCHTFNGSLNSFLRERNEHPLIPVDPFHAITLGWIDIKELSQNALFLNDKIRAAIALVT